jgi:DNA helicase-4
MSFSNRVSELCEVQKKIQSELKNKNSIGRTILRSLRLSSDVELDRRIIELSRKRKEVVDQLEMAFKEVNSITSQMKTKKTFLLKVDQDQFIEKINSFNKDVRVLRQNQILSDDILNRMSYDLKNCQSTINDYNRNFIKQKEEQYASIFNSRFQLDEEQKQAIITDDKFNLVVAGSGSGKTEVLITRIIYLSKKEPPVPPERILALAFQRKAVQEIESRLADHNIEGVHVKTFHKLGKDILKEATGEDPTGILEENLYYPLINQIYYEKLKQDPDFYSKLIRYVKTFRDGESKDNDDMAYDYAEKRYSGYKTISNITVKSGAEKEIMDFFLMHKLNGDKIKILYEPIIRTTQGKIYSFKPDFCLPDFDIYIEHWALNDKREIPKWFGITSQQYIQNMESKKKWFREYGKPLVETFSYEFNDNHPEEFLNLLKQRAIEKLKSKIGEPLKFELIEYPELIKIVWGYNGDPIPRLIANYIHIAKTFGYTPSDLEKKLAERKWSSKQESFSRVAIPIFIDYEKKLRETGEIDFSDMINRTIYELENNENLYNNRFDHILIDEYQDISTQRFKLIKALLKNNPNCHLFCVGDDWQSIMGFAGSNLNFFVNFGEHCKNPSLTKISTNYRSIKSIIDTGADIIKKNGENQIAKPVVANRKLEKRIEVREISAETINEIAYLETLADDCTEYLKLLLRQGVNPHDILVLSRYRRHPITKIFTEKAMAKGIPIVEEKYSQQAIRYLTVHKSKGLEAKIVFLLNVVSGDFGFPCEIEDPTIFDLAKESTLWQGRLEEERRLFYVAITRAKDDVIIYTWARSKSQFLNDIADHTTQYILVPQNRAIEKPAPIQKSETTHDNISMDILEDLKRACFSEAHLERESHANFLRKVVEALRRANYQVVTNIPLRYTGITHTSQVQTRTGYLEISAMKNNIKIAMEFDNGLVVKHRSIGKLLQSDAQICAAIVRGQKSSQHLLSFNINRIRQNLKINPQIDKKFYLFILADNKAEEVDLKNQVNDFSKAVTIEDQKNFNLQEFRSKYPKAYEKWTAEEDHDLTFRYIEGASISELAIIFQRNSGAIRSRLHKLGLIDNP